MRQINEEKAGISMLFVLTGAIQIGKSRWLEAFVRTLDVAKTTCYGVISAGIWVPSTSEHANEQGFEKLGIESILLPQGERFEFAKRNDIAREAGAFDAHNQAARAGLGWHISEEAIAHVNEHFAWIAAQCAQGKSEARHGLLIVDELGMLELDHNGGFTEAVKLLSAGPSTLLSHALVVARSGLEHKAAARFRDAWEGATFISPDESGHKQLDAHLNSLT